MHSIVLVPIAALFLLDLPVEHRNTHTPCPCEAQVVVISDTALAYHPGFEATADTSLVYRLGFLRAAGISKRATHRLMKKMELTTGGHVKCDRAFLRSLCAYSPSNTCLQTVEIKAVGPLNYMPDGSLNITLRFRAR